LVEKFISGFVIKEKKNKNKNQIKTYVKDIRLFTNTIKQAVDSINSAGLEAKYVIREDNDKYVITIDIPIER
jgi:ParB family chromosome partitioning protein